jgi:hypothetical protein
VEPVDVDWVGDASTSYGIGIAVGGFWSKFKYLEGWESNGLHDADPKRKIAWAETVAVRLGLILLHHLQTTSGKRFVVWTDNTTTEGVLRTRKSGDESVNEEWKTIQLILKRFDCDLLPKRVTSGDNRVDDLSRGIDTEWDKEKKIVLPIPDDLKLLLRSD